MNSEAFEELAAQMGFFPTADDVVSDEEFFTPPDGAEDPFVAPGRSGVGRPAARPGIGVHGMRSGRDRISKAEGLFEGFKKFSS